MSSKSKAILLLLIILAVFIVCAWVALVAGKFIVFSLGVISGAYLNWHANEWLDIHGKTKAKSE